MLPFLKKKHSGASLMITERQPDGNIEEQHDSEDGNHAMEACAEDILRAISAKDAKHLALALQAAYDCCESDDESEDSEDNSYHAMNELAAKGNE